MMTMMTARAVKVTEIEKAMSAANAIMMTATSFNLPQ
jgi:hypothetical protein